MHSDRSGLKKLGISEEIPWLNGANFVASMSTYIYNIPYDTKF